MYGIEEYIILVMYICGWAVATVHQHIRFYIGVCVLLFTYMFCGDNVRLYSIACMCVLVVCLCVYMYMCAYIFVYVFVCLPTCTHTYIHIHRRIPS